MPTVYVTREVHFNAAHRLHNPAQSDAWNEATFGPCNSPNWHGHNYVMHVTVRGEPDPDTGYVVDLGLLKAVVHEHVVDLVDHRNLNVDVDFLQDVMPSSENLAVVFWNRIAPHVPSGELYRIRLYETPRNFVDYYGDRPPA